MLSCYFDVLGICELFSTDETCRPCLCDNSEKCDFYISDDDVHKAAKLYAVNKAVKRSLRELEKNKDGD